MKKIISLMLIILVASSSATLWAGRPVSQSELPKAATAFITKYFAKDNVRKVEVDKGYRGDEYEVEFTSGAEVDFKADGTWKEVKAARGSVVPSDIVPQAIAKYVAANFKGLDIVEISRKRGGYEVELSNGTELKLTEEAQPMQPRGGEHRRH